ncbi:alternative ribosome rescue aminoacyl-tRNA hydrolase ArfB [Salegentibacter sp. HM20]
MEPEVIIKEFNFKAVRSSGAGGQHVNKTSSKVELYFHIENSKGLSEEEKSRLAKKLENRITTSGEIILSSELSRSQHKNKEDVQKKFFELIEEALKKPKPRKKTGVSRASKLKRLRNKKLNAEKKANRQNPLK